MTDIEVAREFMRAAEVGDIEAARACFHPDAGIWHNYDNKTQTLDENLKLLGWMVSKCRERRYNIRRLEPIEGGYLQQHTLELVLNDGSTAQAEALAVVLVDDGRIKRIEEYIDPAPLAALGAQR